MKIRWSILVVALVLFACSSAGSETPPAATLPATATLLEPQLETTRPPDAIPAAQSYLDAWKSEDYPAMYTLLTALSQEAVTAEQFEAFYRSVAAEAALSSWDYEVLSSLISNPRNAQVAYRVTLNSVLVGAIQRDTMMSLTLENGAWRVQWDEGLIIPELRGGNYLRMDYQSPSRANIYDRNGRALVAQTDAVAIGLDTGNVDPESQDSLLTELWRLTGVRPEKLAAQIDAYRSQGWYLAVGDVSAEDLAPREAALSSYSGVILSPFRGRYYFNEGISPHAIGYVSAIQAEEVEQFKRLGYNVNSDRIGQKGLESWGEQYLGGKRGGVLYLIAPDGSIITRLAESATQPAQAIYTTLDRELQIGVQDAMSKYRGAIVVLERDTGRILAMASSPGFNPNLFEPQNFNYSYLINDLFDQNTLPLLNRATQGQYPLGSVFKIITISAALQSGLYTSDSEYNCEYFFTELSGVRLNDWTYDHFLEDGETQPSGLLTLPEGLMRSCNPWFWHIGLDLFNRGMIKAVSDMARGFGLGSDTGIEIPEESGQVPDPGSQLDATNLAIGQGSSLVTPLQVANFIAAVGNGGNLYRPTLVERIAPPDGEPTYTFTPTVQSTLPISDTVLSVVQDAMFSVVSNRRGTAHFVLSPFSTSNNIPIAGKTGTAETGTEESHAWFAGYTNANRQDKPDIAVVVIAEYAGEGSEVAAPIFKRVMEIYFLGRPQTRYPWEAQIGVLPTPTSLVTDTPVPSDTPEASPTP